MYIKFYIYVIIGLGEYNYIIGLVRRKRGFIEVKSDLYLLIMSAFDCNKVLPNDMIVKSIDDFLYEIGLCHQSVNDRTKRSKINSPKLISTVLSFQWIVSMASLFTNDETLLILLTDVGHFQGIKVNAAIAFMLLLSMGIFNQLVYYMNYKRGIEPTFLRLFQVMSGSLRPIVVGLTEESQWRSLLKIA